MIYIERLLLEPPPPHRQQPTFNLRGDLAVVYDVPLAVSLAVSLAVPLVVRLAVASSIIVKRGKF